MELLTYSRQASFKTCRKAHWFGYEQRIRPVVDAKALRQGSAYHAGLESWANTHNLDAAVQAARDAYWVTPDVIDERDWQLECETVVRLLCGYTWRWEQCPIEHVAAEQSFELPLLNPETNKPSKLFKLAGKIDGIVRLEDGRLAVLEHKLLGDDIGPDSELWRRMRMDHQVSLYVIAARALGHDVTTVLYDVARKPTIRPSWVSECDSDGCPIVLDEFGQRVKTKTGWRKTGDKDKGYVLQERECSIDEWGDRLGNDIGTRPEFYFQRVEIARLDDQLAEFKAELWDIAKTIREAQTNDRHYRTVSKQTCPFCSYVGLCERNFTPGKDSLPEHFVRVENVNPELSCHAIPSPSTTTSQDEYASTTGDDAFDPSSPF